MKTNSKTDKEPEAQKEERRGRTRGREREEGDIDRAGNREGLGGERAGSGPPVVGDKK